MTIRRSLAVLIDADNASARHARAIFDEIANNFGEAIVRRVYGDFSDGHLKGWNSAVQSLAILQHQQRNNTTGKNAADIALVIDAMDLMHKGKLDGVCLVSSDSDFTRLTQRLREDGLEVFGFGQRKTPEAFRNACSRFIYVENLIDSNGPATEDAAPEKKQSPSAPTGATPQKKKAPREAVSAVPEKKKSPKEAVQIIARAVEASDADDGSVDGWANLSHVGSRIRAATPDFDSRSYGCPKLITLVHMSGGFEVRKGTGNPEIRRKVAAKRQISSGKKKKSASKKVVSGNR